jgi:hypothetical protein
MRNLFWFVGLLIGLLSCGPAMAQSVCSTSGNANTLYCAPILAVNALHVVGGTGTIASPTAPPAFSALNAAVGIQLSEVPTPSPASGITFAFGPNGLTRQQELGPIFSEAPPTVGTHKLYLAFTYQHLQFDQIDLVPLNNIPLQISGCDTTVAGCGGFITTSSRLDLKVNQFTAYATFGLFNRVDLSVAIPLLEVRMGMLTTCSVCGQQQPGGVSLVLTPTATSADSTGLGDVTFRVKGTVFKGARAGLAVGVDVRTPTGNDLNFLGLGTVGVRPFAAFGYRGRLSPHVDIGYQENGSSILASSGQSGSAHLPNLLNYSAGLDFGFRNTMSLTGDFLAQTFFSANRVFSGSRAGAPDISCSPSGALACQAQTFTTKLFALGAKEIAIGNFLVTENVLFKLDHNGLHFKPAPMVGISYTF